MCEIRLENQGEATQVVRNVDENYSSKSGRNDDNDLMTMYRKPLRQFICALIYPVNLLYVLIL